MGSILVTPGKTEWLRECSKPATPKELYVGDPQQRWSVNLEQPTNPEVGCTFQQILTFCSKLPYNPIWGCQLAILPFPSGFAGGHQHITPSEFWANNLIPAIPSYILFLGDGWYEICVIDKQSPFLLYTRKR